jgi:hypothetical protein
MAFVGPGTFIDIISFKSHKAMFLRGEKLKAKDMKEFVKKSVTQSARK